MTTQAYWDYMRLLAREDGAPGSRDARAALDAAGKTYTKDVKIANQRVNRERAERGLLDSTVFARTKTTTLNSKRGPTAAGKLALQRAAAKSPLARRAQAKKTK